MFKARKKIDAVAVLFQTTQNDIYIRERIKEAHAMEHDTDRVARRKDCLCKFCHYRGSVIAGQAFTDGECGICRTPIQSSNTYIPVLCRDCAKKHSLCRQCGADMELRTRRRKFDFPKVQEIPPEPGPPRPAEPVMLLLPLKPEST